MNTAPLKIMHVILSRGFAGSERSTAESCNQQCIHNEVTLVISKRHRRRGASIVDHLDPRVKIRSISSRFLVQRSLSKVIAEETPQIIHCHLRRSTRVVAKISPTAATVSTLHISVNGPHFQNMDGLVCNARWQLSEVPSNYGGKTFKANNSVTPHRRLSDAEITQLRAELGVQPEIYLIGAVGRYHPSKAWDTLIKAFKANKHQSVCLIFFGSGSQEAELKQLAQGDKRVVFAGYRENIKDLYQCFDLLVCPSRFEPLPRVILEGMDAGVPVLASDSGGCKELIDDYGGFLFETDNVAALAGALEKCITTKPARHTPDLTEHHIENANRALENFYRELVLSKGLETGRH
ncbi:glycosyltransferase involved in cell wall biosynthesis [Alteromonadaceae bacterium 2753L.S.0a.02]|nr:glycosyltransferase involved in cell wall biosynthesis [Alteromonadaceae bacterium 2753L.S.0a.02]